MIISEYSFLMAILTTSLLSVVLYLMRKSTKLVASYGVTTLIILFLGCIFRMTISIEIPEFQVIISDYYLLPFIRDFFNGFGLNIEEFFVAVWFIGSICFLFYFFYTKRKYEKTIFAKKVSQKEIILNDGQKSTIIFSSAISVPISIGYTKPIIIVPDFEYSDEDMEYIILHEYIHYKNRDPWVLMLTWIFCSIFWWNPLFWLLKRNLSQTLEIKCDLTVTSPLSENKKMLYMSSLLNAAELADKNIRSTPNYSPAFLGNRVKNKGNNSKYILQRFDIMLSYNCNNPKMKPSSYLILVAAFVFLCLSYILIWQPHYPIPEEEVYTSNEVIYFDDDSVYILKKKDGTYQLVINGVPGEPTMTKEEYDKGYHKYYKVILE